MVQEKRKIGLVECNQTQLVESSLALKNAVSEDIMRFLAS